jgi:site-specific DNA-methyltransferase (adenine-specific)
MGWNEKSVNRIIEGDSGTVLREIPPGQIDLVITSPPYFMQREYGGFDNEIGNEESVDLYIENVIGVFRECVRIIKPTGSIIFNVGDTYDDGNLLLVPYRFAIEARSACAWAPRWLI